MGRSLRSSAGGVVYHVLNRRVLRLELFEDDGDYAAFVRVLAQAMRRDDAPQLFAFCLMPNHWHLLLRPRRDGHLSSWMQWLTVTHTHRWNQHHHTAGAGPVYQGRFKAFPVEEEDYFLAVARYVERNPLRGGLVKQAEAWRWSSLGQRHRRASDPVEAELRQRLAAWPVDRPRNWRKRVNQAETQEELEALRLCVHKGRPLGRDTWVKQMADRLGLCATLRPRGRPKREDNST